MRDMKAKKKNLPLLSEVISKVKNLEELTDEEELIYLMYIEEVPEADARQIINSRSLEDADE